MDNKEIIIGKLKSYDRILKVIWYLVLIVGLAASAAMIILCAFSIAGRPLLQSQASGVELLAPGIVARISSRLISPWVYVFIVVDGMLEWLLLIFVLFQVRQIYKGFISRETPFFGENIAKLKKISYYFLSYAIISFTFEIITGSLLSRVDIFKAVEGVELFTRADIPLMPVICGIIIFGVADIFDYGLKLQEDSDAIL